jgi:hypothetical protein
MVRATPVDPRDNRWEVDHPAYRVYFWLPGITDEWELEGADVDEVLRWAADNADGRQYVVYTFVSDTEGPGLIRLLGSSHP